MDKATTYRFTVFAKWPSGDVEEIDVDVEKLSVTAAKKAAQVLLDRDYEPGGKLGKVVGPRVGLYT